MIDDDDMDPIAEIRAIRAKNGRKYKTMSAYFDHLRTVPSADVLLAQVRAKIAKAKEAKTTAKPSRRPASRRRKTVVHA